ncbi:hypothetical protein IAD21_04753 [Abditibacteriota bacterium]|nr:hypothetical protein IAD21_04753 [Abditibacteriota bacterium]
MKRIVWAVGFLALAGCEQTKPPTAEGLKLIAARTARGTVNTKLESKTQPSPPLAGNVSIWDFKVFDIADKPDGTRTEWKFFNALPQSSTDKSTTEVLMDAWLISKDRSVFLPQKPAYKQYGSFITDWTIPQAGFYTLWVEYQPVKAKDELNFRDIQKAKAGLSFQHAQKEPDLAVEHARWEVAVGGTATSRSLTPSEHGGAFVVYSLDSNDYAAGTSLDVAIDPVKIISNQKTTFSTTINGATGTIGEQSLTALSPDGQTLLHDIGANPQLTFAQKGKWRAWFAFEVDGKPYVCPIDLVVKTAN